MRTALILVLATFLGCGPTSQPAPAAADAVGGLTTADSVASGAPVAPAATDTPDGAPSTAATPSTSAAVGSAPAASSEAEPADPTTLDLTRGVRIDAHGLRIMLRGTRTEHQPDSSMRIRAELEVRGGDDVRTISIERRTPGAPSFVEVFDVSIALDSVDAARKPSTARILVRTKSP